MLRPVLTLLGAILVLAACAASGGADSPSGGLPTSPAGASGEPDATGGDSPPMGSGVGSLPASITDPIVADAATRLGVDPSAVTIVEAKAETFSDGSLGCPEPGMMYTQALVDGYQVVVEANGTQLDYRASAPGRFRICQNP